MPYPMPPNTVHCVEALGHCDHKPHKLEFCNYYGDSFCDSDKLRYSNLNKNARVTKITISINLDSDLLSTAALMGKHNNPNETQTDNNNLSIFNPNEDPAIIDINMDATHDPGNFNDIEDSVTNNPIHPRKEEYSEHMNHH